MSHPEPRIDGAVHIWSGDGVMYPWSPHDGHELPDPSGSAEELLATLDEQGFHGAVCVQPRVYGYDHAYLIDSVRANPGRLRGVCLVNPVRASGPRELTTLVSEHGMSGLRLLPLAHQDPAWFVDESGDPLWIAAQELGVPVSVLVRPDQISLVAIRALQFPSVNIVVDHLGSSPSGSGESVEALTSLAVHPNVSVKISALGYFATSTSEEGTVRAAVAARDAFGPDRVIFGTDWPYATEIGTWGDELILLRKALGTRADEPGLLGANAARLWGFGG